jgi:hypothetical protein
MWNWLARSTLGRRHRVDSTGRKALTWCDAHNRACLPRRVFSGLFSPQFLRYRQSCRDGRACRTQRIAVCRWRSYGVSK